MRILIAAAIAGLSGISAAQAADLGGSFKDGPVEVYVPNWSGLYVGGSAGLGTSSISNSESIERKGELYTWDYGTEDTNGAIYGLHLGYNWQAGRLLFGVEAGFNGTNLATDKVDYDNPFSTQKLDWYGTGTARLGYAAGNTLFYGFGGVAWGKVNTAGSRYYATFDDDGYSEWSRSTQHVGWTAGLGLEHALSDRLSARVEYSHVDLGEETYTVEGSNFTNGMVADAVKIGANKLTGGRDAPLK